MLLNRILELKLLPEDTESNILKDFPLEAKINMIYETNTYITGNIQQTSSTMTSAAHVSWIMELVGKGFSLPISEHAIIYGITSITEGSIKIYSAWLTEPNTRPAFLIGLNSESPFVQEFFQKIFRHASTLFSQREPREIPQAITRTKENPSDLLTTLHIHIDICRRTLQMLLSSVSEGKNVFTDETWTVILKVLLGISDILLKSPKHLIQGSETENNDISTIADNLAVELIHVYCNINFRQYLNAGLDLKLWIYNYGIS